LLAPNVPTGQLGRAVFMLPKGTQWATYVSWVVEHGWPLSLKKKEEKKRKEKKLAKE